MRLNFPVLLSLGLLAGLTPFAIDMYLPGIPAIAGELEVSVDQVQFTLAVYLGVFALGQLLFGPLSDVTGRRATVFLGLALFFLGALLCMVAPSLAWLINARAVQALGAAAVAVAIPALVRDLFEKNDYARTMSLIMLVMGFAPMVAPTLGGAILTVASWRWVFLTLALIAVATALLYLRLIPETLPPSRRHRLHLANILRNYRLLTVHPEGMGYLITASFGFAGMMSFIVASPFVYIELYHVPEQWFGVLFGVNVVGVMLCVSYNARHAKRLGADRLLRFGLNLQLPAALLLGAVGAWSLEGGQPPLWWVVASAALYLSMNGFVLGNAMAGFMAYFPSLAGTASAFAGTVRFGAGALAGAAVSLVHDGSIRPMLWAMSACGVLTAAAYQLLRLRLRRSEGADD